MMARSALGGGRWPRCWSCDELVNRDSGRCADENCPGRKTTHVVGNTADQWGDGL